ncbi:hypothetical protein [Leucobacter massiliensis]|uniref:Signal peptidase I n=1 Tax=Leucobacter massiliensis TaxID=1686285 RepID=A0A2S9QN12_9MICO|nr:hypothetical protein [Leucobacter massiliensis]PRI10972.1 hypothetical protein B4915_08795 [Leucobacter massiliensis]
MFRRIFGTVVTSIVVAAALALAGWFAYSATTGAALVVLRTGSMSPTMPQGTVAVTLPVRAAEVRAGDVLTVQRAGAPLPVTHRVIEVRDVAARVPNGPELRAALPGEAPPDPGDPAARELVMQGDDNDTPDRLPYVVTEARRTVVALPHLGTALMLLQTPIGAGLLILGVGALVTWAFWPARPEADADACADDGARPPGTGRAENTPRHAEPVP